MGSRKGIPNKSRAMWEQIEEAKERKIELAKTKTREAIDLIKQQHNGQMSIDAIMKMQLDTIQLIAARLNVKANDGLMLDRDDVQSLKDVNAVLLTMRGIEKELLESLSDEDLIKIAESRAKESELSIENHSDGNENK